jgi:lambda family phage tail tape measure protein
MDIASLSLRIDSTEAKQAAVDLDALSEAGARSSASLEKAGNVGQSYGQRMTALLQASRQTRSAQVELNAEQEKFISALQRQVDTAGMSKSALLEFKAAELGVADQAKLLISQLQTADAQFKAQSASAKQAAHSLEGFSLQSSVAKRELLVMSREIARGDFTRLSTSASIFAQSSGLLALALTPLGLLIGGVAAATIGLVAAYTKGDQESRAFANSLTLTGNYAGITEGQYNSLAQSVAKSSGVTIGSAREVTQELIKSGKFSGDALGATAKATELLSRASGESAGKIVKDFIGMTDGVARWAEKTNESYHFLTAAQLEYIRTLEDQGDKQKAIAVTMDALSGQIQTVTGNVGFLERAWIGVKGAASSAIEAMLSIGRVKTPDDQIKSIQAQLEALDTRKSSNPELTDRRRSALQEQLALAKEQLKFDNQSAAVKATINARNDAEIAFGKLKEQTLTRQEKLTKELAIANALADKAGTSDADRQKVLDNIREKYKGPKGAKPLDTSRQDAAAQLALDVEDIKKQQDTLTNIYANAQKVIAAQHAAGLIDDKSYSDSQIALINLVDSAEQEGLSKKLARLEVERDRLATNANHDKQITADRLKNAREIIDVQAQISKATADAATKAKVVSIQQTASINKVEKAYEDARDSAQRYLDTITRAQTRDLEGFGIGNLARSQAAGKAQIQDKYEQQRLDLERSKRDAEAVNPSAYDPGTAAKKAYDDQLALISEFQQKALSSYDVYYAGLKDKQANWGLGAKEALQNYYDDSQNIYKQTEELVSNSFKGMEDALTTFVSTGKLSFKSLANSILADIDRMIVKEMFMAPLAKALGLGGSGGGSDGGFLGGLFSGSNGATGLIGSIFGAVTGTPMTGDYNALAALSGARAAGGPVSSGGLYQVNEKGPELLNVAGKQYLMMGDQAGSVTPNNQLGGGGNTVNVTVNQSFAPGTTRATTLQAAADASRQLSYAGRNL